MVICPCFPRLCALMRGPLRASQGWDRRQVLALARRKQQAPPQVLHMELMAASLTTASQSNGANPRELLNYCTNPSPREAAMRTKLFEFLARMENPNQTNQCKQGLY